MKEPRLGVTTGGVDKCKDNQWLRAGLAGLVRAEFAAGSIRI